MARALSSRILLVRHCESSGRAPEAPLSDHGHTQTRELAALARTLGAGTEAILVSRPSTGSADYEGVYTWVSNSTNPVIADGAVVGGDIVPGVYNTSAAGDAPTGALRAFEGLDKQGKWSLFVTDNVGADVGSIFGWAIGMSNVPATWRIRACRM